MSQPKHLKVGEWGEKQAEMFLKSKKYRILGRRVRIPPHDEIDIVARDGKELVFVEVKTRKNTHYGRPASSVDSKKRASLCRGAVRYIKKLKANDVYFRFDIVEVIGEVGENPPSLNHIVNAFCLSSKYMPPV